MKQSKITFLTSLGAGLEYYDYAIYSLLANFISKQFFPSDNQVASLFATFGVLTLGNLIRPLGAVILGIMGDRRGRKVVFANTLLWMASITFLMGLIPSFTKLGIIATALFSICRLLQGCVMGAELPGALTFLLEHIDEKRRGLHFGCMVASVGLGVSLGSLVTWALTSVLTESQMLEWGFRVPYFLGGGLAIVGFYIRKNIPETPIFLAKKRKNLHSTATLAKQHIGPIFVTVGMLLLPASLVNFFLILPTYLHDNYGFAYPDIYFATSCGYVWTAVLIPILGWLSDYIGQRAVLIAASAVMILFGLAMFSMLQANSIPSMFGFIFVGKTILSGLAAGYFVLLPQAFQTNIRYTGTAFSYNIAYTIAAVIPLITNYIYGVLKAPYYMGVLFTILAGFTLISTIAFRSRLTD